MATRTLTPFNLLNGNPFELEEYDVPSSSEETQLRAMEKGIRERDGGRMHSLAWIPIVVLNWIL